MNKNLAIAAIVILLIGGGAAFYFGFNTGYEKAIEKSQTDQAKTSETAPNERVSGEVDRVPTNDVPDNTNQVSFQKTEKYGYYGTLTVTGYLDIQTRTCNPGDMCGETVDYASFVITKNNPEILKEFAATQPGTTFISADRIGLGCYQKEERRIYYENFGDSDSITSNIVGSDLAKLEASTRDKPVELKLTKPVHTTNRNEPDCYSLFRNFDLL